MMGFDMLDIDQQKYLAVQTRDSRFKAQVS